MTTRLELFEALRTIAPLDRAVVVLRCWDDRTVAETAHEVGLSEGAVRTRSSRALARLRVVLSDDSTTPGRRHHDRPHGIRRGKRHGLQ